MQEKLRFFRKNAQALREFEAMRAEAYKYNF